MGYPVDVRETANTKMQSFDGFPSATEHGHHQRREKRFPPRSECLHARNRNLKRGNPLLDSSRILRTGIDSSSEPLLCYLRLENHPLRRAEPRRIRQLISADPRTRYVFLSLFVYSDELTTHPSSMESDSSSDCLSVCWIQSIDQANIRQMIKIESQKKREHEI